MSLHTSLPVTPLDEAFLNLGRLSLMSVQFELRVSGRLDADRLAKAMRTAALAHPLVRARLAGDSPGASSLRWEIGVVPDHLALEITDDPADDVRARLQSFLPDLSTSPGLVAALVREAGGDRLMLNLHHAAFDGMSAVRLMTSIARAYVGADDPIGGPEVDEARDLRGLARSRGLRDVTTRATKIVEDVVGRRDVTRVATVGGEDGPHYAFATVRLDEDATAAALATRPSGCTVNDLVIAALVRAIMRWNGQHDVRVGSTVSVMMPVNLRPPEWSGEVLSNFASYVAVVVPTGGLTDLAAATQEVQRHTGPVKENGVAGWIVDVLEPTALLPRLIRRNLQSLLPIVDQQFVESTTLSNLGRVSIPDFGDAGPVTEVWFSPPSFGRVMPLVVGVAGVGRELHLSLRSVRAKIGPDALDQLATLMREALTSA